ncbi:MAG: cytochrome P450 [Bacteroidota bacterium]
MPPSTFPPRVPKNEFFSSQRAVIKDILAAYLGYQERFGDIFGIRIVKRNYYVTSDPTYISHVMVKNHRNYIKDRPTKMIGDILGNGILVSDGDYWLRQRRLIQPAFHRQQIANLSQLMVQETEKWVEELTAHQGPAKLNDWMPKLALQVVTRTLFGEGIKQEGIDMVNEVLTDLLHLMAVQIRDPFTLLKYKLTGKMNFFREQRARLDQLIFDMVDARQAKGVGNADLMDMLLSALDEETGEPLTKEEIRQELIILFTAGHETSANGMTYALMLLADHPEILEKATAEVDRVLGKGSIDFTQLRELTYLKQVIDESLRLYPPAWITGREALGADTIGELELAEGETVAVFIYGLHRNEKYWEHPNQFDPARFHPDRKSQIQPHTYIPFGMGPRLCVGNQFAVVEMQIALAMILQRFRIQRTQPGEPIELIPSITLRPKTEIGMTFEPRK